ncbi:serine hydrolase [Frigoribacterium sp. PvP032]|uniref:serine hydrolase domain-containing protein n=1 Tax=Frigoribacterium sp. PvP032 TaxID=2806589 RepID=UPI001AE4EB77|nr:serine hydrolase domain-containing protein [Frigoribacterium sp. PvP032]MBP1189735.1 CubicO group peptidase (beta-lactamase class C family) [Frigoribacterium sp. PvP032]
MSGRTGGTGRSGRGGNERSGRRVAAAVVAGVVTLALGAAAIPRPPSLSPEVTGDEALIGQVRDELPAGAFDRLAVAVVDGDEVTRAEFGTATGPGADEFEIGSVTKTITASLYAVALQRGEVQRESTLGDVLGVTGAASSITLEELATQHSGLPRLPADLRFTGRVLLANLSGADPYTDDVAALVGQASRAEVDDDKPYGYSNFGMALLGQALATAADTPWEQLVAERVAEPLGLADTYAPGDPEGLRPDAPTGFTSSGRHADAWTMRAFGPAGSVRSTLDDMVAYTVAQRDDRAPGVIATEPLVEAGDGGGEIGWAWQTTPREGDGGGDGDGGGTVTWHDGMTGGYASFVGFDRDSDRAVVVLSSSAVSLDDLAFELLEEEK